ncbi:winged helix-turn-helix transcriptional regulator [Phanerochaete sordida]|uniref:Winged helix-turn-helix transcriptional regulator n=1 Tax=Phanerochaete sordida TaxID=48140 RepID=A0A9P3G2T1_9APHY|nr:winged helix-turn-helix transcriptional regulator [Phanerochaete sordida]
MSADQQLAIARAPRGESTHLSRTAAKVVPPFLQKLYEIVNDPKNDELIRWSDAGDSFYVLNHERFAREVLGRWFKHQKFTSFVRQLNMYGFHKIPHLQQGVLKSETDTEPWHFEHPHFHRGQPDLLCLIQRKKQPTHGAEDIGLEMNDPVGGGMGNLTAGQVLDINSIMNGIAAIKRHQQAISADLNELKSSNQHLWQEALAARERHKKHQDTINRILKFLAGVFGSGADAVKHDVSHNPSHGIPRKRQRLMIGDGGMSEKRKSALVEEIDEDDDMQSVRSDGARSAPLYATIDTPTPSDTVQSPRSPMTPSIAPNDAFGPTVTDITSMRPSPGPATPQPSSPSLHHAQYARNDRELTPTQQNAAALMHVANAAGQGNLPNGEWSQSLQNIVNSPGQLSRLMHALASHQNQPVPSMVPSDVDHQTLDPRATSYQMTAYDPNAYDFSRLRTDLPPPASVNNNNHRAQSAALAPSLLGSLSQKDDDGPPLEPLMENANRLQKSYRDANEIEADVDALQYSLNSLINGLGLDPSSLSAARTPDPGAGPLGPPADSLAPPPTEGLHHDPANDFDFDAFLNELSSRNGVDGGFPDVTEHYDPSTPLDGTTVGDASTDQLTAFLDDVAHPDAGALDFGKPATVRPGVGMKRKSDVAELPPPLVGHDTAPLSGASAPKVKRKR